MVQEHKVEPRKMQEPDLDRGPVEVREVREVREVSHRSPTPVTVNNGGSSVATDVASGLALVFSIIAFFFSSYAVIQSVGARRDIQALRSPTSSPTNGASVDRNTQNEIPRQPLVREAPANRTRSTETASRGGRSTPSFAEPISRPLLPFLTPWQVQRVEPGKFIQPAYEGGGEVELLSVRRTNVAGQSAVNVQLRVKRLRDQLEGVGDIDLAQTTALNTRTNQRFSTLRYLTPSNEPLSLYNLRPGQSVNATLTLQVPEDLDRIDLQLPETRVFRNVPIETRVSRS